MTKKSEGRAEGFPLLKVINITKLTRPSFAYEGPTSGNKYLQSY